MSALPLVLLVQLPIPSSGSQPVRGNVPLAAGCLKLAARRAGLESRCDLRIVPAALVNTMGDASLVERLAGQRPFMVGFTCYLWNIDRTLWIAERVKQLSPQTRIVLGGPEITADNAWVLEKRAVDFHVIGEGEQTFARLLEACLGGVGTLSHIAGLSYREGNVRVRNAPPQPMADLDAISSPYLEGILSAADEEQLLLETVRGCIFNCKFCYYPKAYDRLYFVSREKILANLRHGREHGAREVYLLDPTVNQRRDFAEFLDVLAEGNPARSLEFYAELRGEGIKPEHARRMRRANFREVEIGLQSVDPATQALMDRPSSLRAFERGVRALRAEGVAVKVDLIIGLPGDDVDSVRRGMHYLAEQELYDDIQVFQLSVLPGTAFRHEAPRLGLKYQERPPYYILETPTMTLEEIVSLQIEAEEIFGVEFDAEPPPELSVWRRRRAGGSASTEPGGVSQGYFLDLDEDGAPPLPSRAAQNFSLWFRGKDLFSGLDRASRVIRNVLERNPFSSLQIYLETGEEFPFNVFADLRTASRRRQNVYLDRFYEFAPAKNAGALRFVTLLPAARRGEIDADWVASALAHTDIVWIERGAAAGTDLRPMDRIGEWVLAS